MQSQSRKRKPIKPMHPATPIPRWVWGLKSVDNLVQMYSKTKMLVHLTLIREFRRISNILSMLRGSYNTMRKMWNIGDGKIPMLPSGGSGRVLVITVKKFLTLRIASAIISDMCHVALRFPCESNANFKSFVSYIMCYFSLIFIILYFCTIFWNI